MTSSSSLVRYPGPGCVVEFLNNNKPQLAWVLEEQSGRLRLLTLNKRETNLPANRALSWLGPLYVGERSRQDILDILARHQSGREQLERGIDPLELWELAEGEVGRATVEWLAGLVWASPDSENADNIAALGRVLLDCKTHFKFQPPDFEIYPREKVETRLAELALARERERIATAGWEFFQQLWALHVKRATGPVPPIEPELACKLEQVLRRRIADPDDKEFETLWNVLRKGLPEESHLALMLAVAWGLVPSHYNYLLDQAAYDPGDTWAAAFSEEIAAQQAVFAAQRCDAPLSGLLSIDSETTRDVDDAFEMHLRDPEKGPEGGFRVRIALACPALGFDFSGPLGCAVRSRATSLYLPEGDSHMLPESLGTDTFSLRAGEPRPVLLLTLELDGNADVLQCTPAFAWVRVAANLSYPLVEQALCGETDNRAAPFLPSLELGWRLAERLRLRRIEQGAIVIERPEPEIVLSGSGAATTVDLVHKPPCPRAQLLVSEFMILATAAVARWGAETGVPLFYRTQDIAAPKESAGVWSAPEDIHRVVKVLGSSILETRPRAHACLGVRAYSPITSPLRRYADLINLAQVLGQITVGQPRFDAEELAALLPELCSRLEVVGRVQRFRPRYWKLVYFKQQPPDRRYPAVVVEDAGTMVMITLPREQLFLRGPRTLFGDKIFPGQRFAVRLGRIDPLNNDIHVREAWEDDGSEGENA